MYINFPCLKEYSPCPSPDESPFSVPYLWKSSPSLKPPKLEILTSFIFNLLSSYHIFSHPVVALGALFFFSVVFFFVNIASGKFIFHQKLFQLHLNVSPFPQYAGPATYASYRHYCCFSKIVLILSLFI